MKLFKKLITLCIVCCIGFILSSCEKDNPKQLATPTNVQISATGRITWDKVENATSYVVKINSNKRQTTETFYQVGSVINDFTYSVYAKADGFVDSAPTETYTFNKILPTVGVGITGASEVQSGKSIQLSSTVTGDDNKNVVWSITKGSEYATINDEGLLTAKTVESAYVVTVRATADVNPDCYSEKQIVVLSKPILTQEMLDELNTDLIGFEGYIAISLYEYGLFDNFVRDYTATIKTAMDGTYWYAEYVNATTDLTSGIHIKNNNGYASEVSVSYMNDEEYFDIVDEFDRKIPFIESGYYNCLKNLRVSDFEFNEETWKYDYIGSDPKLDQKVLASTNPYDFKVNGFSLVVDDTEILGIYAKSLDDYNIVQGYKAIQELLVLINYGDAVEVEKIGKFEHVKAHEALDTALNNMHNLESYTTDYLSYVVSYSIGATEEGFVEKITNDMCYFEPYTVSLDLYGDILKTPQPADSYGFKKINDNLYNAFFYDTQTSRYKASRAYESDFASATPSFGFVSDIFTRIEYNTDTEETTYYVDPSMSSVASTFYYGVGTDINLYGIFAQDSGTFTPYVTVSKEGYIINSGFYFYLGIMYGLVEISYSDFNTTTIDKDINFETRNVPKTWNELLINKSNGSSSTDDDVEVNAKDFLVEYFNLEASTLESSIPFFGSVLGDTYGFGLETQHYSNYHGLLLKSVVLYYDVPLDTNYTIDSSMKNIKELLVENGFTKYRNNEYNKGDLWIAPVDSDLDLLIYVWRYTAE